ncbi:olfactory receptor 6M1-like [Aquarana catesbeiana]|uniref:olfactory receptor 6M1-like n=1 Tax=Aquarana catesbeiana TaxID=8400 RepID=UPI003CC99693
MFTNFTGHVDFTILGFSVLMSSPVVSFTIVLNIYVFNVVENSLIILTSVTDLNLHKPMYFFLGNLSLVDMSFTSVTLPKTMQLLLSQKKTICFVCCIAQMYFFLAVGVTESFLLALMSYDRYLAICNPLRYQLIMTQRICAFMVLGCWFGGFSSVLLPVILISKLPFCQSHDINHFFCDVSPIIQLACSDIRQLETFIFFTAIIVILGSFSVIVISYLWILLTILEIKTSTGKKKAFSTCSSHLTAISIYFGTIIFMYIRPKSKSNLNMDKQAAVFYSVVTPTLNPLIYTLRNNEFKMSLKRLVRRSFFSS